MYVAPMGRPISSPPSDNSNEPTPTRMKRRWAKTPDHVRDAIIRDSASGMKQVQLSAKHGVSQSIVSNILRQNGKPTRRPGETAQQYGGRITAWKLATQPTFREERGAATSRGLKAYHRKKRRAAEREAALAAERAANMRAIAALEDAAMEAINQPAPQPTFWQRYFGWLWS